MADQSLHISKVKKVHAIHQKFRSSNPVVAVLVWGINHTMDELSYVAEQPLIMRDDFKAYSKIRIENQFYNSDVLPSKFKFKEYCPLVFRDLRTRFGVSSDDYTASFCEGSNMLMESSAGRSSSFFCFTDDKRFVAKSISTEEVSQFHTSFAHYHSYIVECNGNTYLPHYLGLYRLTIFDKETYIVVMKNVLSAHLTMTEVYDLKGSTFERHADHSELEKEVPILKDNDFLDRSVKLDLGTHRESFVEQLERDVNFLSKEKLMDYSLLLGIYRPKQGEDVTSMVATDTYAIPKSIADPNYYFIGIIDTLTFYGAKKKAAHTAKEFKHGKDAEISTVNPDQYARRFLEFVYSIVSKSF